MVQGNYKEPDSKVGQVIAAIRKRKGLKDELPPLSNYLDKL